MKAFMNIDIEIFLRLDENFWKKERVKVKNALNHQKFDVINYAVNLTRNESLYVKLQVNLYTFDLRVGD